MTEEELLRYYPCKYGLDPYKSVWKGIYLYPVLQWMRTFGERRRWTVSLLSDSHEVHGAFVDRTRERVCHFPRRAHSKDQGVAAEAA
eukprot:scaffold4686_cov230-Pinguiococcus_pyrenoidosus.AAC.3